MEKPDAPVIEDDDVPPLVCEWCMDKLGIHTELLRGCRTRQEGQHQCKVIEAADKAFHAHHCDVHRGQGCDHTSVAFVADDADPAGLRDSKIYAANAYIRCEKDISQYSARGGGK